MDCAFEEIGEFEYLIGFQVSNQEMVSQLEQLYQDVGLPRTGASMTDTLITVINAMSDGITASTLMLIGILLVAIAGLCLRFTMLATMEEEYRQIGVMKAIGINWIDIRKLYMTKHLAIAASACLGGFFIFAGASSIFCPAYALYGQRAANGLEPYHSHSRRIACLSLGCPVLQTGAASLQTHFCSRGNSNEQCDKAW